MKDAFARTEKCIKVNCTCNAFGNPILYLSEFMALIRSDSQHEGSTSFELHGEDKATS